MCQTKCTVCVHRPLPFLCTHTDKISVALYYDTGQVLQGCIATLFQDVCTHSFGGITLFFNGKDLFLNPCEMFVLEPALQS